MFHLLSGTAVLSLIDFPDPLDPAAPRLRHALADPAALWQAHTLQEVAPVLAAAEAAARAGAWVLGWVSYEAAPAWDRALQVRAVDGPALPLAWFAVYPQGPQPWPAQQEGAQAAQVDWAPPCERSAFDAALAQIQQGIAQGRYYQVNYTASLHGALTGSPQALFAALQRAQPQAYAACVDAGAQQVLSVSPELFFHWRSDAQGVGDIHTRPMKGTAARGSTPERDAQQAAQLQASAKERAENVMIVDLLRNDLSRIAQPHSVQVEALFHLHALPTVWQMTSDVRARTRPGTTLGKVFAALFPCGSVTGAPKVEAMRAIAELETEPRGVYCGALGLLRPDPAGAPGSLLATFNVPIRTVQVQGHQVRCGIGSGIVWGARADAEWQEWLAKQAFLVRASAPFELLETLALVDGQWRHLPDHLARLRRAAVHFHYPADDEAGLQQALQRVQQEHPQGAWRVRLLLDAAGHWHLQAQPLAATPQPVCLALASAPFAEAHSEFTRYKTTRRAHYAAFAPAPGSGVFDTVLYNAAGEITETTFGNIAALLDGQWVTPPLACGLLPGVGRAQALRAGRVREGVLHLHDIPRVQAWAFINSLRGWLPAQLLQPVANVDNRGV